MKYLLAVMLLTGCAAPCRINNPVKTTWATVSPTDETEILLNFCDDGRVTWTYGASKARKQ